jgi:IS5 family transposase
MRPKERRETGQSDLFRARLDQIVDPTHPLVRLAGSIDWGFLEARCGAVYDDDPGRPPLPTRLMAGLAILKHLHDLSDEVLCARWIENPYFQLFCGEEFFQHQLPFDRSSLTRWRQRMGEDRLVALLQESLSVATRTGAAKPSDFTQVIIDTTVQEKAIAFPTAKLLHWARSFSAAGEETWGERASPVSGRQAPDQYQRYAHAAVPAPPRRSGACAPLGQVIRDIGRKITGTSLRASRAALPRPARQGATAAGARPQGLCAARARGRVHRQGQGPQALRVRCQGLGRNAAAALPGRPVRRPRAGAAGQPL